VEPETDPTSTAHNAAKGAADLVLSTNTWVAERRRGPQPGVALCLSGGGYRAMLFHVGALWRLNDAELLPELKMISSVSGGSITAGVLGLKWPGLGFDDRGYATQFAAQLVDPLRKLAGKSIDRRSVCIGAALPFRSIDQEIARCYRKYLFDETKLKDLPLDPWFVFNTTNLQSTALWRFSPQYARDYLVGEIKGPNLTVAEVVAASSAFPPILSPATVDMSQAGRYEDHPEDTLTTAEYREQPILSDGGVYDNLGLEVPWKRYQTVLVSDGGGKIAAEPKVPSDWLRQSYRVMMVIDNQVRSLRKRALMSAYKYGRRGTYWGIRSDIGKYRLSDPLPCPTDHTERLAAIPTRLKKLDGHTQARLINWGFAICDTALRRYYDRKLARPDGFPYPNEGVG
jgi:NTE family protein